MSDGVIVLKVKTLLCIAKFIEDIRYVDYLNQTLDERKAIDEMQLILKLLPPNSDGYFILHLPKDKEGAS